MLMKLFPAILILCSLAGCETALPSDLEVEASVQTEGGAISAQLVDPPEMASSTMVESEPREEQGESGEVSWDELPCCKTDKDCDDHDPCTIDICDPKVGCTHTTDTICEQ